MGKKFNITLLLLSIFFLVVYLWTTTPLSATSGVSPRFDWPDETANYFWSVQYAQTGHLALPELLNNLAGNQIHPRSFNVRPDGALVPGSFLGLILLFGSLAKIFSTKAIIYFTPIFGVLAALAFYRIVSVFFNKKVGMISAVLMLIHPAWWYYSASSLLPNVVFVSCVLFSIFFLLRSKPLKIYDMLLAGFFIGLALSIRPAEIIWLAAVYIALMLYLNRVQALKFRYIFLLIIITVVTLLPSLLQQQLVYGSYFTSGYNQLQSGSSNACQTCGVVQAIILPFGFHPSLVVKNFWLHFVSRLWWLSLLTLLGLAAYIASPKVQSNKSFGFFLVSLLLFAWLGIYYGSWEFTDQLTVNLNTLGLSYVRYWLPLYLLSLPFTAIGLVWLSNFVKERWQNVALVVFLLGLFYASAQVTLFKNADSLWPVKNRIAEYQKTAEQINELTENEAVIVTVRKDKVFFPERRVIHTFDSLSDNQELQLLLPGLIKAAPVYYFALGPEATTTFSSGISLLLVKQIGNEMLYQIK